MIDNNNCQICAATDCDCGELINERAAIMQHDGKLPAAHADALAMIDATVRAIRNAADMARLNDIAGRINVEKARGELWCIVPEFANVKRAWAQRRDEITKGEQ